MTMPTTRTDPTVHVGGWINGFIGGVIFSGSLPATRVAVQQFDPVFLTVARAAIAGILGLGLLLLFREKRPTRRYLASLIVVALGVMLGFPLLTALALQQVTAMATGWHHALCRYSVVDQ